MAIAYARSSIHSRSKGHSAVAASAYRAGVRLFDERTGETHDFTKRQDVAFSELVLPEGVCQKFEDREFLWNEAERAERRRDAQVSKELVMALPRELDKSQQIELSRRFAHFHFVQHGIPVDFNIHDKGDGNPHLHLLYATRRLEEKGFNRKKARDFNPGFFKGKVVDGDHWGRTWGDFQNEYFTEMMLDIRVDFNHVIPEKHQGRHHIPDEHYLKEHNDEVKELRHHIAVKEVNSFVELLSLKHSVFSKRDIEKLLFKSVLSMKTDSFQALVERVLANKNIVELGLGDDGLARFTTRQHYVAECRLFESFNALNSKSRHLAVSGIDEIAQKYTLSYEQKEAFKYTAGDSDLSVIVGKPGTGKTYMLKALKELYELNGYEVIGATIASKTSKGLEAESGINSSTIASLNYRIREGKKQLTKNSILVIDEAGMVDFSALSELTQYAKKACAKLILVGDSNQLKPVGKGDLFRGIAERFGYISLNQIKRQRDLGDRQASIALSRGDVNTGLNHYDSKGAVKLLEDKDEVLSSVIYNWKKDIQTSDIKQVAILSFTTKMVHTLNQKARNAYLDAGYLGESTEFEVIRLRTNIFDEREAKLNDKLMLGSGRKTETQKIQLASGERLIFKQKSREFGVDNGDVGTVIHVGDGLFEVELDSGKTVKIDNSKYKSFDYAYSVTVHKSQGMTIDKTHVVVDSKFWNQALSYVSMTRHRDKLKIYSSKTLFNSVEELAKSMSRKATKDNVIDYPVDFALRYGFDPDSIAGRFIKSVVSKTAAIKDRWSFIANYDDYLKEKDWSISIEDKEKQRAIAKDVALYLDAQQKVSKLFRKTSKYQSFDDIPDELREKFYKASLERDSNASELIQKHGESSLETAPNLKKIEHITNAAKRFETHQLIMKVSQLDDIKDLAKKDRVEYAALDIKASFSHIANIASTKDLEPKEFAKGLREKQSEVRKSIYQELAQRHPVLKQYDQLIAKAKHLSGFAKEKAIKQLAGYAKEVVSNKELARVLQSQVPNKFKAISHQVTKTREQSRGREQ